MIIAALSIFPVGESTSLSKYVKESLKALDETGLKHESSAMATIIEASNLDQLFSAVKKAHEAQVNLGAKRIYMVLTVDDRKDREATIGSKMKAIS